MILMTFTWQGILLPPAPSAPPKVGPGCNFCFSLPPPFTPTRAWTDSPKKKKRSEILNEIMEHLEEEDNNKDEDI